MADLLIDTNVVSYIGKGDSRAAAYGAKLVREDLFVCCATVAELYQWTVRRNWGTPRIQHLQRELQHYTVIGFDDDLAWNWARITSIPGHPIEPGDAWIAAAALRHNIPLVTHNRRHFEHIPGLVVISEAS
jgi:tRNA(fMet)-specific endonuclease VapC